MFTATSADTHKREIDEVTGEKFTFRQTVDVNVWRIKGSSCSLRANSDTRQCSWNSQETKPWYSQRSHMFLRNGWAEKNKTRLKVYNRTSVHLCVITHTSSASASVTLLQVGPCLLCSRERTSLEQNLYRCSDKFEFTSCDVNWYFSQWQLGTRKMVLIHVVARVTPTGELGSLHREWGRNWGPICVIMTFLSSFLSSSVSSSGWFVCYDDLSQIVGRRRSITSS